MFEITLHSLNILNSTKCKRKKIHILKNVDKNEGKKQFLTNMSQAIVQAFTYAHATVTIVKTLIILLFGISIKNFMKNKNRKLKN